MLNPLIYEKFIVSAGCPINPPEAYRHVLDVYTITDHDNAFPGLPLDTNTYIKNVVELAAFSKTAQIIGSIPKGKRTIKTYRIQIRFRKN